MKINTKEEQCYTEEYNSIDLKNIIDTQHKIIEFMKSKKDVKHLFQIRLVRPIIRNYVVTHNCLILSIIWLLNL